MKCKQFYHGGMPMNNRDKIMNVISYLISVKNLGLKSITDICEYEKVFWQKELLEDGCDIRTKKDNEQWIEINKSSGSVYDEFFKLYLKLQKSDEQLEIVFGYGFLLWGKSNKKIAHPLFTVKTELIFDRKDTKIILKPIKNKINLEVEILKGLDIKNIEHIMKIKTEMEKCNVDLCNVKHLEKFLKDIIECLDSSNMEYKKIEEDWVGISNLPIDNKPIFYSEPLVLIRKVNNRPWKKELIKMLDKVGKGEEIPPSIEALVDEGFSVNSNTYTDEWSKIADNLLFPLPYNKEQGEIVKRLSENFGVVVQGPPGTGKSHTIVNLICHLVAHGKRVLVTSQRENPLRLILNNVPENIRPLCMSLAGNELKSLNQLEYSIKKITESLHYDIYDLKKEWEDLEKDLKDCKSRQKSLYIKLKEEEEVENGNINYGGKAHKLLTIAKWLKETEVQYDWIEDSIDTSKRPPITDAKFSRLLYLISNTNKEEMMAFNQIGGFLYSIPNYNELLENIRIIIYIQSNYNYYKSNVKDWSISYNSEYDYDHITRLLENTKNFLKEIEGTWLKNVLNCVKKGEFTKAVFQQTILKCNYYIKKILSIKKELSGHAVEIPKDMDMFQLAEKMDIIYNQFKEKGKINKFFKIFHSDCQEILEKCSIDLKPIETKEQCKLVKLYIDQYSTEISLKNIWNSTMREYECEEIEKLDLNTLASLEDEINKIDIIANWNSKVKANIIIAMKKIAFLNELDWYSKETYDYLKKGLLSIKYISQYENLKADLSNLERIISNVKGFEEIVIAIKDLDIQLLSSSYKKITKLKENADNIREVQYLLQIIYEDCPILVDKLINDEDRLNMLTNYKKFSIAWLWKQLDTILKKAHRFRIEDIEKEINKEKENENKIVRECLSKKSWYNQIIKVEENQKRSLYSWMEAIKRVGKGKGKNSINYMKLAQKEMENFKDIAPVWIMPINKVIESFSLSQNMFDVVIIDESSQCDIFAISALFRAKKAVIVGDDNQISPEAIGVDSNKIQGLIDMYLKDIPNSEWFDMQTSLYSTALRIMPNRIMLKEHFRCVPEIIEFSNKLCYSGEVIPLRRSNIYENLGAPIKVVKVEGNRDLSKSINVKEAEALVNKIEECCLDERYNNMTMGVISLLGDAQCELIENLLKEKIGEKEIINRKLLCGNAYSFQGDERDVMFLSMVISNNVKFTALTKESDIRRFNVASSRARNQMWVFHSVDFKSLNEKCVRAKFLNYCMNFGKNNSNKSINLKSIFESQLQKDVYRAIKEKGYDVKPQVTMGKYKMDFVIDGLSNKIAIQCDGDKMDSENWEEKYQKKACLERVGWEFLTVNGSEFYRRPEETIKGLLEKIEKIKNKKGIA